MSFIVVKHAGHSWPHYWDTDPKLKSIHISHSAAYTHTGKINSVEVEYEDRKQADEAAKRCNIDNPSGDYAVCECKYEVNDA